jgi:epoxyqueuosine reductase
MLAGLARHADPAAVERYGLLESSGAVVAAFPYDPRPGDDVLGDDVCGDDPGGPPPYLRIGAFAARNRYAALTRLLLATGKSLAAANGLPAKSFRAIVNSRLPEKRLAAMAGLGFIGRSSLLVTHAYGPACVIGALLLPGDFMLGDDSPELVAASPGLDGCGSCRACVDACPTGAIGPGGVDLDRCLQAWATRPGTVPDAVAGAWGRRLYGCDACAAACPRSAKAYEPGGPGPSPARAAEALLLPAERRPGAFVSSRLVSGASDAELSAFFRKTALGLSWIRGEELRRNAAIALGAGVFDGGADRR